MIYIEWSHVVVSRSFLPKIWKLTWLARNGLSVHNKVNATYTYAIYTVRKKNSIKSKVLVNVRPLYKDHASRYRYLRPKCTFLYSKLKICTFILYYKYSDENFTDCKMQDAGKQFCSKVVAKQLNYVYSAVTDF